MACHAKLIPGLGQDPVSDHLYRAGVVLQDEVFRDEKRHGFGDRPVDGDFLVFVVARTIEDIFDLGCGQFIELLAGSADKGNAEDQGETE